jgi:hypothetical protein
VAATDQKRDHASAQPPVRAGDQDDHRASLAHGICAKYRYRDADGGITIG